MSITLIPPMHYLPHNHRAAYRNCRRSHYPRYRKHDIKALKRAEMFKTGKHPNYSEQVGAYDGFNRGQRRTA